ncbi:MAG: bifunctional riboflavin kinase/FAD synthetase [Candidatus Aminicenantes bacterium]|jgi:riboflavin kinase/FMN adenylyltransferase
MKIITNGKDFPSLPKNTSVAIGNFDGVHLGHQKILNVLTDQAKKRDLLPVVLTFSPHPKKVVGKGKIHMLQSLDQRLREVSRFPVYAAFILNFDKRLANRSARDFIENIVLKPLKARQIIVGENFCFGRKREGCTATLKDLAPKLGFHVRSIPPVFVDGVVVSSSNIRKLLWEGKVDKAAIQLGRYYEIEGDVIKGKSRGKTLGFPTANIQTPNEITPSGVFLSQVTIDGTDYPSLTNIGTCPTFQQQDRNIETYILSFSSDLYGKKIRIRFLKKVRDEIHFDSPKALTDQIQKDIYAAEAYFNSRRTDDS